jgi:transposase-like protein
MKRKKFSKEFKAKVALEAIKGQLTANEIASEHEVHVTQVNYLEEAVDGQCRRAVWSGF